MDAKVCRACSAPHFNEWELCHYCAAQRRDELERRLQQDDDVVSIAIVAGWVQHGFARQAKSAWTIG